MAGNHRSGRKRKPIEHHLMAGTFRQDRHGPRPRRPANDELGTLAGDDNDVEPTEADEIIIYRLENQGPLEKKLDDMLFPSLEGVLQPTDSAAYAQLLAYWGLFIQSLEEARKRPTDKVIRSAVLGYGAAFDRLASKFGLSPADRAAMHLDFGPRPEPSALDKFLNRRKRSKVEKYLDGGRAARVATSKIPKRSRNDEVNDG